MARLPGIDYKTGGLQLGRNDIYGPIRVANAEAAALSKWGNVVAEIGTKIETNDIAAASAQMSNEMAELNAYVKNTKTYDPQELRAAGMTIDGDDHVPAHEVSVDFYKLQSNDIYERHSSSLGIRGRRVLEKTYASKYATGISDVIGSSIKYGQQYSKAQVDMSFEGAVRSANAQGASDIASVALANGTWSPEQYATKMTPMLGRVREAQYLQALEVNEDLSELERLQREAVNDPILNTASANRMYGAYNTKIRQIEKIREAELKEIKIERSSNELSRVTIEITEGVELSGAEIGSKIAGMRPADRNTALSVWRAQQNEVSSSNEDSMRTAAVMIRGTLLPDGTDLSFKDRRDNVQLQIDGMLDRGDLTIADHRALVSDLKAVQKVPMNTPEFKMVEDDIYLTMTGASKGTLQVFDKSGQRAIGLANTMWELNERALQMGDRFNPTSWWDKKKPLIITKDMEKNQYRWEKSVAYRHATITNDRYDPDATVKSLQSQLDRGEITQDFMNMVLTESDRHQKYMDQRRKTIREMGGSLPSD